jgi:hypothetical protein
MNKNTPHIAKFIKTSSFECETQILITALTLYVGFHVFPTSTLTSSPPAKETIYSTLHPDWGRYSWYHSADGIGGVLGYFPGRHWVQGSLGGASQPSDFS